MRWQAVVGDWETAYRKTKPESKELKHSILLVRMNATKEFHTAGPARRHEPSVASIIFEERSRAKKRRKAQRIRTRERRADSSSEASSDSSSSSSADQEAPCKFHFFIGSFLPHQNHIKTTSENQKT